VNDKNANGETALLAAAVRGHAETVETLLAHSADMNAKDSKGITAIEVAVSLGHDETVDVLVARGAKIKSNTAKGSPEMLASLVCDD
jgi:ankyrin repeat protein